MSTRLKILIFVWMIAHTVTATIQFSRINELQRELRAEEELTVKLGNSGAVTADQLRQLAEVAAKNAEANERYAAITNETIRSILTSMRVMSTRTIQ